MYFYSDLLELIKIFDSSDINLQNNSAIEHLTNVLCINKISYQVFSNGVLEVSNVLFSSMEQELGENYDFTNKSYNDKIVVLRIYRYQYAAPLGDMTDLFNIFAQIILNKVAANENFKACESVIFYDQQYGIYNINSLNRQLNRIIGLGKIADYYCGYINIVQCGSINSIFGGAAADLLLSKFCNIVNSFFDSNMDEIFARLGGDNFMMIVHKDNLDSLLDKIKSVNVTVQHNDEIIEYTITTRIGLAKLNSNNNSISSVMNLATTAYGMAKNVTDDTVYVYHNEIQKSGIEEANYAEEIKQALDNEKFLVYYQPIVSKNNEEIKLYSAEALIRWRRQGEMLNPRTFLEIADKYKLMCQIDLFVLRTVCKKINQWKDEGITPICIHCNFADSDLLTNNLADKIIEIIDDNKIHHSLINIEFAESAYHNNKTAFIYTVSKLHDNGIKVSIDNFGKGFTSLELFEYVDFSTLKIDSVIVNSDNSKTRILLTNLISLADNLGIEVVCEGANTESEIERAFNSGCDIFQSEVFEKALSERYFTNRLKNPVY